MLTVVIRHEQGELAISLLTYAVDDDTDTPSPVFRLSPDFLGTGKAPVTDASIAEVAAGVESSLSGESCDVLYCQEYPECRITKDCASILSANSIDGIKEAGSPSMAPPRHAGASLTMPSFFLATLTALIACR